MIRTLSPGPRPILAVIAVFVLLAIAGCSEDKPFVTVIRNANVITMDAGQTDPQSAVVVLKGEKIVYVGPEQDFDYPENAKEIDAGGGFLIPGLIDAHVHITHPSVLEIFPAFGVTTVFELSGSDTTLAYRDAVEAGALFGPRILTSGPQLESRPGTDIRRQQVDSAEDAAHVVDFQAAKGFDFLKIYSGIKPDHYEAAMRAAGASGLPVTGHLRPDIALGDVVGLGQANIAHGEELLRYLGRKGTDPADIGEIVSALSGSKISLTPNLIAYRLFIEIREDAEAHAQKAIAQYIHPCDFLLYLPEYNSYAQRDAEWLDRMYKQRRALHELTRRLHDADLLLLAGSDAGNPGFYPGWTLHAELDELVTAGLSRHEALATATANIDRFLRDHVSGSLKIGRIRAGYEADLVLLGGNPLDDLSHLSKPKAVVLRGEWFNAGTLDARLGDIAAANRRISEIPQAIVANLMKGDYKAGYRAYLKASAEWPEEQFFNKFVLPYFVDVMIESDDPENLQYAAAFAKAHLQTFPDQHSAHYLLARVKLLQGETAAACAALSDALALHPWFPEARRAYEKHCAGTQSPA